MEPSTLSSAHRWDERGWVRGAAGNDGVVESRRHVADVSSTSRTLHSFHATSSNVARFIHHSKRHSLNSLINGSSRFVNCPSFNRTSYTIIQYTLFIHSFNG